MVTFGHSKIKILNVTNELIEKSFLFLRKLKKLVSLKTGFLEFIPKIND
jgi:hypothetical protein